jgi:hypothetical protein
MDTHLDVSVVAPWTASVASSAPGCRASLPAASHRVASSDLALAIFLAVAPAAASLTRRRSRAITCGVTNLLNRYGSVGVLVGARSARLWGTCMGLTCGYERRRWDLNPWTLAGHTISSRADSAALALLRAASAASGEYPLLGRLDVLCGGWVLRNVRS